MAGCGCKDDKNIPVAKIEDGEPVVSQDMADKYAAFIEDIKVKPTDNDLEARLRMLESELNLWKQSYEELSADYVALLDGGEAPVQDTAQVPELKDTEIVVKMILSVKTANPEELVTCDVFDNLDVRFNENDKFVVNDFRTGVVSIGDQVFIDD